MYTRIRVLIRNATCSFSPSLFEGPPENSGNYIHANNHTRNKPNNNNHTTHNNMIIVQLFVLSTI